MLVDFFLHVHKWLYFYFQTADMSIKSGLVEASLSFRCRKLVRKTSRTWFKFDKVVTFTCRSLTNTCFNHMWRFWHYKDVLTVKYLLFNLWRSRKSLSLIQNRKNIEVIFQIFGTMYQNLLPRRPKLQFNIWARSKGL
jgi:hypothetical protein